MNGLFPWFRIIDNCEVQDLDRTWSNVLTPTSKSSPACQALHQAAEPESRSGSLFLGLPSGEAG